MSVENMSIRDFEQALKADPMTLYATHFGIPRRTAKTELFHISYGNSGVTLEDYVREAIRNDIAKQADWEYKLIVPAKYTADVVNALSNIDHTLIDEDRLIVLKEGRE